MIDSQESAFGKPAWREAASKKQSFGAKFRRECGNLTPNRNFLVRAAGVEPALCHQNWILSPARLPVPPRPRGASPAMNDSSVFPGLGVWMAGASTGLTRGLAKTSCRHRPFISRLGIRRIPICHKREARVQHAGSQISVLRRAAHPDLFRREFDRRGARAELL